MNQSLELETISFPARLQEIVSQKPDAPAVSFGSVTIDWRTLDLHTNRIARALKTKGIVVGDLVSMALPNGFDFIKACWALWKIGATPQPVSWRLPKNELNAIVNLSKSKFVLAEPGFETEHTTYSIDDLIALSDDDGPLPDIISPHWKAPTSGGSTGRPKLILSGGGAEYTPLIQLLWRIEEADTAIMPGPLYHNGPLLTAALTMLAGGHLVLMSRFDPEEVLKTVARHRATWLYLVPTMMNRIWRLADDVKSKYDVSTLKTVWHLAAPCPVWLKEAWIEWLGSETIWELYAGTEAQAITVISGTEWLERKGSVGRVFGAAEMKAFDEDGNPLPAGEIGEIYMKRAPDTPETYKYVGSEIRRKGEWESLGDMGYFDQDGYLYLADRRTDMILVGGANVYPAEVESALESHPGVQSCAVIGLPDNDLGNRIHGIVQARGEISETDLRAHISDQLVPYKRPHTLEFVDYPLRDDAGKVRRGELRSERLAQT